MMKYISTCNFSPSQIKSRIWYFATHGHGNSKVQLARESCEKEADFHDCLHDKWVSSMWLLQTRGSSFACLSKGMHYIVYYILYRCESVRVERTEEALNC